MGEENLRGKWKERFAEALVLPEDQLQELRVKEDTLRWRVSIPHGWEGSPLGILSRGRLGVLALSPGPCSPASCIDPQVVLSLL